MDPRAGLRLRGGLDPGQRPARPPRRAHPPRLHEGPWHPQLALRAPQGLPVGGGAFDVLAGAAFYVPILFFGDLAYTLGGEAYDQGAGRELAVLRHDGAGGDDGARAYLRAVEDGGAHPDQAPVTHLAAVDDSVVPDHASLADGRRETGVGMKDAAVLNVRPGADPDGLRVATQHRPVPDARALPEVYLADNERARRDPRGGCELR